MRERERGAGEEGREKGRRGGLLYLFYLF